MRGAQFANRGTEDVYNQIASSGTSGLLDSHCEHCAT